MLPKVAIVVFVRNEYPDFCSWLAWHFALGVDTIIVYDDHSDDGTWDAAVAASRGLDVRPRRTDLSTAPFTARQRESYLSAIREFRDEFDWIGFIDADEFLFLRETITLPAFLDRFPDAAAIAFSWCIYGSNGHLLKPRGTPIEAFTRHSLPGFEHNRSVKSFVRPSQVHDRWRDPHTFDVGDHSYVDARGEAVHWGGPGGIAHDPDWSVAKLIHFVPRSMEHFIERIKRRSDLQGVTNEYWNVFNMNDVEDLEPVARAADLHRFLFLINNKLIESFCEAEIAGTDAVAPVSHIGARHETSIFYRLTSYFGTVLAVDKTDQLVHAAQGQLGALGLRPVYAIGRATADRLLYLVSPETTGPLRIGRDHRATDVLPFRVGRESGSALIALQAPHQQKFLTALPPNGAGIGLTAGDRWAASDWECFTAEPMESVGLMPAWSDGFASLPVAHVDIAQIRRILRAPLPTGIRAAALHLLSDHDRRSMQLTGKPALPSWV